MEYGWVFIYIFFFGINDIIVDKYFNNDKLLYYCVLGFIGFILIRNKNII